MSYFFFIFKNNGGILCMCTYFISRFVFTVLHNRDVDFVYLLQLCKLKPQVLHYRVELSNECC